MIHQILKRILYVFVRCLYSTYRFELSGLENKEKAINYNSKKAHLIALWHEQVVGGLLSYAFKTPYVVLASRSKDGDFAAYVSYKLGFIPVRGSSKRNGQDKGGKEAIKAYIEHLKNGLSGGVTVDGPKGPRQECKSGVIIMAKEANVAITPLSVYYKNYYQFEKAWDKFKIPFPFSKIYVHHNLPVIIEGELDEERILYYSKVIKDSINNGFNDLKAKLSF